MLIRKHVVTVVKDLGVFLVFQRYCKVFVPFVHYLKRSEVFHYIFNEWSLLSDSALTIVIVLSTLLMVAENGIARVFRIHKSKAFSFLSMNLYQLGMKNIYFLLLLLT